MLLLHGLSRTSVPVDKEYQFGVLGWFERIFYDMSKGFDGIGSAITNGFSRIEKFIDPLGVFNFFGGLDLSGVGDFFRSSWSKVSSVFGLIDLLEGENSPFAWLMG